MEVIKVLDQKEGDYLIAIRRHSRLGHLCGYVGIPKTHPWYGISHNQCLKGCKPEKDSILGKFDFWHCDHPTPETSTEVHGGLTYSSVGDGKYLPRDYWWFGFDCAHAYDSPRFGGTRKDLVYVMINCLKLLEQLKISKRR